MFFGLFTCQGKTEIPYLSWERNLVSGRCCSEPGLRFFNQNRRAASDHAAPSDNISKFAHILSDITSFVNLKHQ